MTMVSVEREANRELFREYARTRDRRTRDDLVAAHIGLARHLAGRFVGRGEPFEDLFQVACLGLLKAVERFEPERGLEFTTFASPTILGELKRHFRDHGWSLHVPRQVKELHVRVAGAMGELTQRLGHAPRAIDLAEYLGVAEDQVLAALEAGRSYRPTSLDSPAPGGDAGDSLGITIADDDPLLVGIEDRVAVRDLIEGLPPRERAIMHLRFYEDQTQQQIADHFGISQMQVSRIIAKMLSQMREQLEEA